MLTVLVVDDDDVFRSETCEFLSRRGWRAEGVPNGRSALDRLRGAPTLFDAVVLDRAMPGTTGDQVIRELRGSDQFLDTCFVMATGFDSTESAVEALKLGAFEYLMKPFESRTLEGILRAGVAWHRGHKMRRELVRSFDRSRIVENVKKAISETMPFGRVELNLFNNSELDDADTGMRRFQNGEEIIIDKPTCRYGTDRRIARSASSIAIPIRSSGQLWGVLSIQAESDAELAFSWVDVLRYYADITSLALELGNEFDRLTEMYREWRHKIATNVQIIAMQARQLEKLSVRSPHETSEALHDRIGFIVDNASVIEAFAQDIKAFGADPGRPALEYADVVNLESDLDEALRAQQEAREAYSRHRRERHGSDR